MATIYFNPVYGDDSTGKVESRDYPFKTEQAALAAATALDAAASTPGKPPLRRAHRLVHTERKPPRLETGTTAAA